MADDLPLDEYASHADELFNVAAPPTDVEALPALVAPLEPKKPLPRAQTQSLTDNRAPLSHAWWDRSRWPHPS